MPDPDFESLMQADGRPDAPPAAAPADQEDVHAGAA